MDKIRALLSTQSVVNAGLVFFAGYGLSAMIHPPARWGVLFAMGCVIANQLGLHQNQPSGR